MNYTFVRELEASSPQHLLGQLPPTLQSYAVDVSFNDHAFLRPLSRDRAVGRESVAARSSADSATDRCPDRPAGVPCADPRAALCHPGYPCRSRCRRRRPAEASCCPSSFSLRQSANGLEVLSRACRQIVQTMLRGAACALLAQAPELGVALRRIGRSGAAATVATFNANPANRAVRSWAIGGGGRGGDG